MNNICSVWIKQNPCIQPYNIQIIQTTDQVSTSAGAFVLKPFIFIVNYTRYQILFVFLSDRFLLITSLCTPSSIKLYCKVLVLINKPHLHWLHSYLEQ